MKKTDKISYREKTNSELQKMLSQLYHELVELKSKHAMGNLKDTSQIKKVRYQVAFINTLLKLKPIQS